MSVNENKVTAGAVEIKRKAFQTSTAVAIKYESSKNVPVELNGST